ncbi:MULTISPECIES: guanitoxin biosynthesis heme-dependent pre-guanitoxin N-hydroxylase GntA [Rhodomicrobium]|uniref:guanitoxin biosynthesis heme-dependent pre-guanitoxin N-hydroxylase GntA n=1 Tax=Rhodomicrobium TaxID=1068 RepID=UPI001AECC804|nr:MULTISPECIES: guanitoxin biosynthesis heme-dependent pre-guanitoxin N-hydroxylase GntA [Rhodomicrobium]
MRVALAHAMAQSKAPTAIQSFLQRPEYPCVGAKSALKQGKITVHSYGGLDDGAHDERILADIDAFIALYHQRGSLFQSLLLEFEGAGAYSELEFEQALWRRLQALHELDARRSRRDIRVGTDPDAADFSFSLGGEAFFIIGMHPGASRLSRRYAVPALVMNLHDQFERLRADGLYERMRDVVRDRDEAFCGTPNPALGNFGELSEARQYSGRDTPADWKCPFRPRQGETQ